VCVEACECWEGLVWWWVFSLTSIDTRLIAIDPASVIEEMIGKYHMVACSKVVAVAGVNLNATQTEAVEI